MRKMLCLALLLLPFVAFAAGKADLLKPMNVASDGENAPAGAVVSTPRGPAGLDIVGTIDTIGGTIYDWQYNGPGQTMIYVDPAYGVHAMWMFSADPAGSNADRNQRYNFYDFAGGAWNFIDPANFMNSGVNCYTVRTGFGNLDVNPSTGAGYVSSHRGSPIFNTVVRDAAPGAGIFEECQGTPSQDGFLWPSISLSSTGTVHCATMDDASRTLMYRTKVNPWCTWATPAGGAAPAPEPGFPTYAMVASKTSTKAVYTFENSTGTPQEEAYYVVSTDDGVTWADPVQIPFPPAFSPGGDSLPSFSISSVTPFLDGADQLHIVAGVVPYTSSTGLLYIIPAEIWHWYQPTETWSKIARGTCDTLNLMGGVGYNAVYATRPSLAQAGTEFIAVWEQFDSMNVESSTGLMRADIYGARSVDNGQTWGPALRITDPDNTTRRFPWIASKILNDTAQIIYINDQVAGMANYTQGPWTNNPVIRQKVWKGAFATGVAEGPVNSPARLASHAVPNPFRNATTISYQLPRSGDVSVVVYDAAGRPIRTLLNSRANPGSYSVSWDGRADNGASVAAGVYFYSITTATSKLTNKLTLLQ